MDSYLDGERNGGVFNSLNLALYTYAANNPLIMVDPDGMANTLPKTAPVNPAETPSPVNTNVPKEIGSAANDEKWAGAAEEAAPGLARALPLVTFVLTGCGDNPCPGTDAARDYYKQSDDQAAAKPQPQQKDRPSAVVMYHYSPDKVLKGPLRKDSFVTPDPTMSSDDATNKLALSHRNVPKGTQLYIHTVILKNGEYKAAPNSLPGNVVRPHYGRPGGGIEFMTTVPKKTLPSFPAKPPRSE